MVFQTASSRQNWVFADLKELMAKATPPRSGDMLAGIAAGSAEEAVAAIAASKCRVVTRFRNTIGLPHTMAVRLQPNHPTDDRRGVLASVIDGLMYGCGDAVIGINPASDSVGSWRN